MSASSNAKRQRDRRRFFGLNKNINPKFHDDNLFFFFKRMQECQASMQSKITLKTFTLYLFKALLLPHDIFCKLLVFTKII